MIFASNCCASSVLFSCCCCWMEASMPLCTLQLSSCCPVCVSLPYGVPAAQQNSHGAKSISNNRQTCTCKHVAVWWPLVRFALCECGNKHLPSTPRCCSVHALMRLHCRWNTPLDEEDVAPEEHRATWGQGEAPPLPPVPASRKRPLEDDDEIDEDVKRRLSALQGGGVD